jgi:hypothetical protein
MTLQVSSGFKSAILGPEAFEDIFLNGSIGVFTGPQPDTADAAARGTLLGRVTQNGIVWTPRATNGGLRFLRNGPYVSNVQGDDWLLVPSAAGIAGWWRLVSNAEDGMGASYSLPRIDGAIAEDGTPEMVLENTTLQQGVAIRLKSFFYTIPPIVGA